jgi:Fe-S-cluster containining protein
LNERIPNHCSGILLYSDNAVSLLYREEFPEYIFCIGRRTTELKEKIAVSGPLKVRQDLWHESPCSSCSRTPCCRNLPLAPLRINQQRDFINLILTSCYDGIFPALKKSGEWTVYLERDCRFLNKTEGKCSIHKAAHQSMVCKSYDAHSCWYIDAFDCQNFSTMIPFNTEKMIWFEKEYKQIESRFDVDIDWNEICSAAYKFGGGPADAAPRVFDPWTSLKLSFKKSRSEEFLFFPPYKRPESRSHFELLSFRLGFPGIYLAVTDTCWAFMVKTNLNQSRMNLIRKEYYPAIEHKDGAYSFDRMMKEHNPFSETGEQWIILQRSQLETLKNLTVFDSLGRVRRLPSCSDLLNAFKSRSPDRAA